MAEQSILWRRLDVPGHDACALRRVASGWRLDGTALFALDAHPCHLTYEVECDVDWCARSALVHGWIGGRYIDIAILSRPGKQWELGGTEQVAVAGCIDVDLSFTPATNLFAIRRLALDVGENALAPAAWLRFPELQLERLEQRYERVTEDTYDYRAPSVDYAETLRVSTTGFVTHYPALWEIEVLE
jgi:uncharacterized protein